MTETQRDNFQKEGNYGQNWNYGQVTLSKTVEFKVGKTLYNHVYVL